MQNLFFGLLFEIWEKKNRKEHLFLIFNFTVKRIERSMNKGQGIDPFRKARRVNRVFRILQGERKRIKISNQCKNKIFIKKLKVRMRLLIEIKPKNAGRPCEEASLV